MSTYEDDHNLRTNGGRPSSTQNTRQHQTLASIIDSFLTRNTQEAVRNEDGMLSDALRVMNTEEGSALALDLLNSLQNSEGLIEGQQTKGVPQEFLDSLERVSVADLPNKDTADCPICTNRFVDDKYPLLVRLPCNLQMVNGRKAKGHVFDLECIGPWLKMNSTCPLCRFDILEIGKKRKERLEEELKQVKQELQEEDDEDWDLYG